MNPVTQPKADRPKTVKVGGGQLALWVAWAKANDAIISPMVVMTNGTYLLTFNYFTK